MARWLRLNFFQRMMLRWRDLHPYNPVHAVDIPAALDAERLRACLASALEAAGLTGLQVDRARRRLCFDNGPAQVALEVVPAAPEPRAQLAELIEREFNRPFASVAQPIRFVAVAQPAGFRLLLVYDHYIAAGDSIARLLTHVAAAYRGAAAAPPPRMLDAGNYRHVLWRQPVAVLRALVGLPRLVGQARRAFRQPGAGAGDAHNACMLLDIDSSRTAALLAAAKSWGVTLNDLLLACLLAALSPLAAARHGQPRRNELAVASILNMRADIRPPAAAGFSPFLAALRVSHRVPDGITLRELALQVHAQSSRMRRGRRYLHSLFGLGVSALVWPVLDSAQRQGFYAKHFAAWGGVTSLNVDAIAADGGAGFDYLRAVPTGPLCPLVLAVTRAQQQLHVSIAFRRAAFPRAAVDELGAALLRSVDRLPSGGPA